MQKVRTSLKPGDRVAIIEYRIKEKAPVPPQKYDYPQPKSPKKWSQQAST